MNKKYLSYYYIMDFIGPELGSEIGGITGKFIGKKIFKDKNTGECIGR